MYKVLHVKLKKNKSTDKIPFRVIHQEHLKKLFPTYGYWDEKDTEPGAKKPQMFFFCSNSGGRGQELGVGMGLA